MAGRKWPQFQEICRQLAKGLMEIKEVEEATVDHDLFLHAVLLDIRFIKAADDVLTGGQNGSLMASAAAAGLCDKALSQADADTKNTDLPDALRSNVKIAFTGAFSLQNDKRVREARLLDKTAQVKQPLLAQIDDAKKAAATSHLLDAFFAAIKAASASSQAKE